MVHVHKKPFHVKIVFKILRKPEIEAFDSAECRQNLLLVKEIVSRTFNLCHFLFIQIPFFNGKYLE